MVGGILTNSVVYSKACQKINTHFQNICPDIKPMRLKNVISILDTFNRRKSEDKLKIADRVEKEDVVKRLQAVEQPYQQSDEDYKSPIKRFEKKMEHVKIKRAVAFGVKEWARKVKDNIQSPMFKRAIVA